MLTQDDLNKPLNVFAGYDANNLQNSNSNRIKDILNIIIEKTAEPLINTLGRNKFELFLQDFKVYLADNASLLSCSKLSLIKAFQEICMMELRLGNNYKQVCIVPFKTKMQGILATIYLGYLAYVNRLHELGLFVAVDTISNSQLEAGIIDSTAEGTVFINYSKVCKYLTEKKDKISIAGVYVLLKDRKTNYTLHSYFFNKDELTIRAPKANPLRTKRTQSEQLWAGEMLKKTAIKLACKAVSDNKLISLTAYEVHDSEMDNSLYKNDSATLTEVSYKNNNTSSSLVNNLPQLQSISLLTKSKDEQISL